MRELRTNTATRVTIGPFYDVTTGITPELALAVTSCHVTFIVDTAGVPTIVLDTAPTASGGANDMIHISGDDAGLYDFELTATNTNYLGRAMLAIVDDDVHLPVFHEFEIVAANWYDTKYSTDQLDINVLSISGSTDAADNLEASAETIVLGTAATGTLSTTEMTTDLTITVDDQYVGRILIFRSDTTTAALRGQVTSISESLITNGKLTFTALTTAPANGDTFVII